MSEWRETEFGVVPASWDYSPLEDYTYRITYGFTNPMPTAEEGPFMVTAREIFNGRLNLDIARRTSVEAFCNLLTDKSRPQKGDVLITKDGSIGRVALVEVENLCISQSVALIRPSSRIQPLFLKYLLESPQYQRIIHNDATGTTIQHIYITKINKMLVGVPNYATQEKIAEVLSSLDDKIDLLQRQNKTLEQMAQAQFRQWFVEGAEDSWELKSLTDIATYTNGLALQKFPVVNETDTLPVIKIREMNQGVTENTNKCSSSIPQLYVINDGDILFSWSGSLEVIVWTGGKGALNQHLFKVTSSSYPSWLIYFATRHFIQEFRDIASDKATTMGHIQRKHLDGARLRMPPIAVINQYDEVIRPLFQKKVSNSLQVRSLSNLRDTLLPKLMSGTVRLSP